MINNMISTYHDTYYIAWKSIQTIRPGTCKKKKKDRLSYTIYVRSKEIKDYSKSQKLIRKVRKIINVKRGLEEVIKLSGT